MALRHSYTVLAPIYDVMVNRFLDEARQTSLLRLKNTENKSILINGIGSGLDIPYLPPSNYIGSDITPAMLKLAAEKSKKHDTTTDLICADSLCLPFIDNHFDIVVMHLILAVVPDPALALRETCRVLKPGGKVLILDKFLRPGQFAPIRRFSNLFLRHIATRTDVVFEQILDQCPQLQLVSNQASLADGWFRLIELEKAY